MLNFLLKLGRLRTPLIFDHTFASTSVHGRKSDRDHCPFICNRFQIYVAESFLPAVLQRGYHLHPITENNLPKMKKFSFSYCSPFMTGANLIFCCMHFFIFEYHIQ